MCLASIKPELKKKYSKRKIGYKLVHYKTYYPSETKEIRTPFQLLRLEFNKTEVALGYSISTLNDAEKYETGFHIYPTRKIAREALKLLIGFSRSYKDVKIIKVAYEGLKYVGGDGTQEGMKHLINLVVEKITPLSFCK